jgi:hypothetical protein
MGIFSISDLIISSTLILNAIALLASPRKKAADGRDPPDNKTNEPPPDPPKDAQSGSDPEVSYAGDNSNSLTSSGKVESSEPTMLERCVQILRAIRRLSCIIVLWNIFFAILMIFIFPR